jgi:hypothetical protein
MLPYHKCIIFFSYFSLFIVLSVTFLSNICDLCSENFYLVHHSHALTLWESHIETLRLEGDPQITKWEVFKTLINYQFYGIGYVEDE